MWRLLPALLLPIGAGWIVVSAAWPSLSRDPARLVLRMALAIGLGLGLASCGLFVALLVAGPSRAVAVAADLTLLVGSLGLLHLARQGGRDPRSPGPFTEGSGSTASPRLVAAVWVLGLGAAAYFALMVTMFPHGEWDAWAIWNLRARFLAYGEESWRDGLSPLIGWSHPDYPLLLPANVARIWLHVQRDTVLAPISLAALFTATTIALAASAVAVMRGTPQGMVAAVLLLGSPNLIALGAWQYADVPQGFFVLAPLTLLCLLDHLPAPERPGVMCLVGVMAGLAAWVKNEGLLALAAILVARLTVLMWHAGPRAEWRQMRPLLFGLVPVAMIVLYHRWWLAPPNSLLAGQGLHVIGARLQDVTRYALVLGAFRQELWGLGGWVVSTVVILVIYAALVGVSVPQERKTGVATVAIVLGIMLAGLGAVYLITPRPLELHLRTSLRRVVLQLWPSGILLYCLCVRSPETTSAR